MKYIFHSLGFFLLIFVLTATMSCKGEREGDSAFDLVPEDTPWLFASTVPLPDNLVETLEARGSTLGEEGLDLIIESASGESATAKMVRAALEEFKGNLSRAGLTKLGFEPKGDIFVYGIGIAPVVRIQLSDPQAFDALIARVETRSGVQAEKRKIGDIEVRSWSTDKEEAIIAVVGSTAIFAVTPYAVRDKVLPIALGASKPANGLGSSGKLKQLRKDHALTDHVLAYLDLAILGSIFQGKATGLTKEVFDAVGATPLSTSPTCQSEMDDLKKWAHRVVFGYEKVSANALTSTIVLEAAPEKAGELAKLRSDVAGLTATPAREPLLTVGAGIDVKKTLEYIRAKGAEIQATPYKCPDLEELNGLASRVVGQTAQVPPDFQGINGFSLTVNDIVLQDGRLADIQAYAVIGASDPVKLFNSLKANYPPLQPVVLENNGEPQLLPRGVAPPMLPEPALAMSKTNLGLSVGKGMQAELSRLIGDKADKDTPLFVLGYNGKALASKAGGLPQQYKDQIGGRLGALDNVGLIVSSMHFTRHGIAFKQSFELD